MTRLALYAIFATLLAAAPCGPASAQQSYNPPAGLDPAAAPGGTQGLAGPRNEAEAIRSGDAIAVVPGAEGTAVERPMAPVSGEPALTPPGVRP